MGNNPLYSSPICKQTSPSRGNGYSEHANVKRAWGEWLRQWRWDWWVTLTFRYPVSTRQAHRLWKEWIHLLEHSVQSKVHYVRVTEYQRFRGDIPHFHALLLGVREQQPKRWEGTWNNLGGLAKVEPYDVKLGATHYLAKYLINGTGDIILGVGNQL